LQALLRAAYQSEIFPPVRKLLFTTRRLTAQTEKEKTPEIRLKSDAPFTYPARSFSRFKPELNYFTIHNYDAVR